MKKYLPLLLLIAPLFSEEENEIAYLEPTLLPQTEPPEIEFSLPQPYKSPFLAMALNSLAPGLGHGYLGDWQTAGAYFGSFGLMSGMNQLDGVDPEFIRNNRAALQNFGFYTAYATYRDVRIYNGNRGYSYAMPTESLAELTAAPFQWSVIKKPEVWGGILGALAGASAIGYLLEKNSQKEIPFGEKGLFPLVAFPVGIGEEALFRGFLQPFFTERLSPTGGIILSSILFGLSHIPNALLLEPEERMSYYTAIIPYITAFGGYFGWLSYKNTSLKETVAIHAWYDFLLLAASYSVAQSASVGKPRVGFSLSF